MPHVPSDLAPSDPVASDPHVFVISRVMRPGCAGLYEAWADDVAAAARALPGFGSLTRLDQAGGMYHLVLHFAHAGALADWCGSDRYRALKEQADEFSVSLDQDNRGGSAAFLVPGEAAAKKWKTALVTWLGVVPTLLVLSALIDWLLPAAPRVVRQLLTSALLTAVLTWIILPRVRGWSRFWMLQNSAGDLRRKSG